MSKSKKQAARPNALAARGAGASVPVETLTWIERLPREIAFLACAGVALFLLAALLSFHPDDPGLSSSGAGGAIHNLVGVAGAWLADRLLTVMGLVAFFLPWGVLWLGIRVYRGGEPTLRMPLGLRIAAGLVAVFSLAALSAMVLASASRWMPQGGGGVAGAWLAGELQAVLNPTGAALLLLTLFVATLPLAMLFSWIAVLEWIGDGVINAFAAVGRRREARRLSSADASAAAGVVDPAYEDLTADVGVAMPAPAPTTLPPTRRRRAQPAADALPGLALDDVAAAAPVGASRVAPELHSAADIASVLPTARTGPTLETAPEAAIVADEPAAIDDASETHASPPWVESPSMAAPAPMPAPIRAATPPPVIEPPAPPKPRRLPKVEEEPPPLFTGEPLPPLYLLDPPKPSGKRYTPEEIDRLSRDLERHLASFGVKGQVVNATPGPVITRFELQPAAGVKGSQITNLSRDLARAMSVSSVRVVEVIEGKSVIGLEIPNAKREMVSLSEILAAKTYTDSASPLSMGMGKDIAGHPLTADLAKMPHLLVAGTTGSGKSVAINAMILSMLFKSTAEELRLILIDPKMLELSVYQDIPHLLTPVVTDMKDAANALRWCVAEMERRYRLMSALGVRNLAGMNKKVLDAIEDGAPLRDPLAATPDLFSDEIGEAPELTALPHIVVIIDELADMMMVVGKKVEELIARLAQKARAAGIHLIVATQRPSVDVITGLIKANIPSRVAFQVASRIDSRTILDEMGAETLLGHGDMLYRPIGASRIQRLHGAFVDDHEVHKVVAYLKQVGEPDYIEAITAGDPEPTADKGEPEDAERDPLYDQAVAIVIETRKASISWVQRRLSIGYNRAARMVEQMEAAGLVGPSGPGGNREILAPGGRD